MSMSFYAEKGESNPFQDDEDLNKVHELPENLDAFLQSSDHDSEKENSKLDETLSDLPEHHPLGKFILGNICIIIIILLNVIIVIQCLDLYYDFIYAILYNVLGIPLDNDQAAIQTTDLDKISQDDEKELASPLEDHDDLLDANLIPNVHSIDFPDDDFVLEKPLSDDSNIASLPELEPITAPTSETEPEAISPVRI